VWIVGKFSPHPKCHGDKSCKQLQAHVFGRAGSLGPPIPGRHPGFVMPVTVRLRRSLYAELTSPHETSL
jgi:hypothetical protein